MVRTDSRGRSQEFLSKIASSYSHDARQPMNVAQLALQQLRGTVRRKKRLVLYAALEQAVQEMGDMIEDMVLHIRLDTGDIYFEQKGINVAADFQATLTKLEPSASKAKLQLKFAPTRLRIINDPRYFRRLLNNLIVNAIVHSEAKKVLVAMRASGEFCVLQVIDNGKGISSQDLPLIFAQGYRGKDATHEGRGMGLYIVKELAERMGGRVEVRSELGKGTEFRAYFPGPFERQAHVLTTPKSARNSLEGRVVAILEDHQQSLQMYQTAFGARGASVIASADMMDLMERVTGLDRVPDLFVLDFMVGKSTSDVIVHMLQSRFQSVASPTRKRSNGQDSHTDTLRIVVVTGKPDHEKLKRLSKNIPVLQKPLTPSSLEILVDVASGKRLLNPADFLN